jgi:hypothetical protein
MLMTYANLYYNQLQFYVCEDPSQQCWASYYECVNWVSMSGFILDSVSIKLEYKVDTSYPLLLV